jgi:oligopeptide/dipeptide ABC transporter ATP-binding protein
LTALLSINEVSKSFKTRAGVLHAVDRVSFEIQEGETLALVGESGCGKSTIALALLQLIGADNGRILFDGIAVDQARGAAKRRLRQQLSIVFQNPYSSLNPKMRIKDIVGEPLRTNAGLRGRRLRERVEQHLRDVGLGVEHMNRFPHEFSGGQRQRIAIARALALEPRLLVLDEPTAALDVSVQAQVLNLLRGLQHRLGLSFLFISHSLATVEYIADRVLVMYLGRIVESGPVEAVFAKPRHPYTQALLSSVPSKDPKLRGQFEPLEGEVPSPLSRPPGCAFAPRCPRVTTDCRTRPPELAEWTDGRQVACIRPLTGDAEHD